MTEEQKRFVENVGIFDAVKDNGWHPESVIDIPYAVITAKPVAKAAVAARIRYDGPLMLAQTVEMGMLTAGRARYLVSTWIAKETGREATEEELAMWLGRSGAERGAA